MCICVNCRHIHNCQTYQFIEKQHKDCNCNKHSNLFNPPKTIINVNLSKNNKEVTFDWDLYECSSFAEEPGFWLIKK